MLNYLTEKRGINIFLVADKVFISKGGHSWKNQRVQIQFNSRFIIVIKEVLQKLVFNFVFLLLFLILVTRLNNATWFSSWLSFKLMCMIYVSG